MLMRIGKVLRDRKGFTLVELMVVVLIIGILVAIAIPLYVSTQANAQKRACQANLRTLMGALSQYRAEYESYPNALTNSNFNGIFIKNIPNCPTNHANYNYDSTNGIVTCPTNGHSL